MIHHFKLSLKPLHYSLKPLLETGPDLVVQFSNPLPTPPLVQAPRAQLVNSITQQCTPITSSLSQITKGERTTLSVTETPPALPAKAVLYKGNTKSIDLEIVDLEISPAPRLHCLTQSVSNQPDLLGNQLVIT